MEWIVQKKRIILILDIDISLNMEIINGIESYIAENNLDWDIFPISYNKINILENIIETETIDGIIGSFAGNQIHYIKNKIIPIVNISSISKVSNFSSVLNDNHKTGESVAEHLFSNKLKHLYFCGQKTFESSEQMLNGFMAFAEKHSIKVNEAPPFFLNNAREDIYKWLKNIRTPCGIFCTNSIIARSIVNEAQTLKLNIPDDLCMVVLNGSKLDSLICGTELSTISPNGQEIGKQSANMLKKLLDQKSAKPKTEYIAPKKIEVRYSSSFIAGKHPKYAQAYTYILNNYRKPITINQIARKIGVSRRKLELIFQEESHTSPYKAITNERIKLAKKLLNTTNMKIIEIAETCGYSEQRQLSVTFKKITGTSPKQFRNHNV
jgi:LacI family transcriptional regulator